MDRKNFLKKLGFGVGSLIIAPQIIAGLKDENVEPTNNSDARNIEIGDIVVHEKTMQPMIVIDIREDGLNGYCRCQCLASNWRDHYSHPTVVVHKGGLLVKRRLYKEW